MSWSSKMPNPIQSGFSWTVSDWFMKFLTQNKVGLFPIWITHDDLHRNLLRPNYILAAFLFAIFFRFFSFFLLQIHLSTASLSANLTEFRIFYFTFSFSLVQNSISVGDKKVLTFRISNGSDILHHWESEGVICDLGGVENCSKTVWLSKEKSNSIWLLC